jgi:error-prone DNA polymerase
MRAGLRFPGAPAQISWCGAPVSFTHLHCHTTWSLLDGAIPAEALPHLAAEAGFEAVAMTDHDALTGAVRFSRACREAGVKPIYGAELTLASGDHVTLIARDARGYGNLCRLISDSHLANERGHPATTFEKIAARAEGLFVLSGCSRGEVARLAAAGRIPEAVAAANRWREVFGDAFRIEVFDHRGFGDRALRDRLLKIAHETRIPAVATNDVHYADPGWAGVHELLHAINAIVPLSLTQSLRHTAEYHLKDAAAMRALFDDAPEACDASVGLAEACDFDLDLGSYHFPDFPIPRGETPTGYLARRCWDGANRRYGVVPREVEERLNHELNLIFEMGFAAYFLLVADIVDHVRHVMGIRCACRGSATGSLVCFVLGISDVDPVRYDLLFERFINTRREELPDVDIDVESHRREEVLTHIARTYGAEQTAVCCMVDTFRARMAIREVGKALGLPAEEIDLVAKAFPRVAARDIPAAIARLPELAGTNLRAGQLDRLFELCLAIDGFPRHLALHPSGVILSSPDLADRVPMQESFQGFTMLQADKDDVEDLGLVKLDVLGVRMLSAITHASDEIARTTGEAPDLDAVPRDDGATFELIRSSRTLGCFQIESPGQRELLARLQPSRFEDLIVDISLFRPGPVQSDMVGPYLQRRHGFEAIVFPHERLRAILAETNGIIVFHEQLIRVIAETTGCSLADADYIRRHLDSERPSLPDDPDSRPARQGIDGPRSGVPADNHVGEWFMKSAQSNGFTAGQAEALWKEVYAFASFGFCKSHAAAFALPTYLSAWLKAHHTAAFLAGVLTHDPGMYPRRLIVADARSFGIEILPVDINASDKSYRIEGSAPGAGCGWRASEGLRAASTLRAPNRSESPSGFDAVLAGPGSTLRAPNRSESPSGFDAVLAGPGSTPSSPGVHPGIRMAFGEVRDISDGEIDSILSAREERPFTSLENLWRRTELSRPVLENLVHLGALDGICGRRTRRELLWKVAELTAEPKEKPGAQLSFTFDEPIAEALSGLPAYSPMEETEAELEITGIDARRHVMELYLPLLVEAGYTPAADLRRARNDSEVWVAGVKVASQTPQIRSGQRIIFVTLDDLSGPVDVTVFERVQARCARTVFHSWVLLVRGVVRKRGGASLIHPTDPDNVGITVVVDEVFDLAELARDRVSGHSLAKALRRQRRRAAVTGLGTGAPSDSAPTKLWHSSGGSAGR